MQNRRRKADDLDHDKTQQARVVWADKKYDEYGVAEELPGGSLTTHTGWDSVSIYIESIEVDKDISHTNTGYT